MSKCIIISASSDIGLALGHHWLSEGHEVSGTFRTHARAVDELERQGAFLVECDLADRGSIGTAIDALTAKSLGWDVLVMAPGSQEPVGRFLDCDFEDWETSVVTNFIAQMRIVRGLMPSRTTSGRQGAIVIFFAGGGTNNATENYSAYTVSKVALIKMCELLDAEIPDARFAILGPGWVKTKIHSSTIMAAERAGANYRRTLEKLASNECVPMSKVVECCDWLVAAPREVISGRNFSLVFDEWGKNGLEDILRKDPNLYKLRRYGNDRLIRSEPVTERTSGERA